MNEWCLAALAAALVLAGCTVGPDFRSPRPEVPTNWPTAAQQNEVAADDPARLVAWWKQFQDPALDSLVERAAASNLDLRAAGLRIAQARAQRDVAAASLWPDVSASGGYSRTRISERTATTSLLGLGGRSGAAGGAPGGGVMGSIPGLTNPFDQYQYGFDAGWEADLFGRVRRSVEAADAATQASVEERRGVLVSVAAEVARSYLELRAAQAEQKLAEDSLRTQSGILELARQRRQSGLGNDLDVANAAAVVENTRAQLPLYRRRIAQGIDQLSALLALPPDTLRAELQVPGAASPRPPPVPMGLPADLLRRRPDIRAAEARLHAATAQIGVADASLFPELTLKLGVGMQAERAADLADWAAHFFSFGPTLELPVFDGGRRRATVRLRDLQAQEAAVDYAHSVLNALDEVDDAAVALNTERDRNRALQAAVADQRDALLLSQQRYRSGLADFLEVLTAERGLQQSQLAEADSGAALAVGLVALYKALGGGWDPADSGTGGAGPAGGG